jgi:hypothetical protein
MPKQKTSYPASRAAAEERPSGARPPGYAGGPAAGAMATRAAPELVTAAVWQRNKRVSALWGTNESLNSWALIAGVGWKKLSAGSDSAALALTTLAALGKLTQTRVDYREESDGSIHELYVW